MKKIIITILFVLLAITPSSRAFAAPSVQIYIDNSDVSCPSNGPDLVVEVVPLEPGNIARFGGQCGGVSFTSPNLDCFVVPDGEEGYMLDGDCPTVTAQTNGLTHQLILGNLLIQNNGDSFGEGTDPLPHKVTITYTGDFSNIDTNEDNYYGLTASGYFFRPPFDLASGDRFEMTSSVSFGRGATIDIGGCLRYPKSPCDSEGSPAVLPDFGSTSLNDFTPQDPVQVIRVIKPGDYGCSECSDTEVINAQVTAVLGPFDSLTLLGSAHTPATGGNSCGDRSETACEDAELAAFLKLMSSLSTKADVKPGNSKPFVGPADKGMLEVTLYGRKGETLCADESPSLHCDNPIVLTPFDVKKVSSVRFGPNCPTELGPQDTLPADMPGCMAKVVRQQFKDDNRDGVLDVRMSFRNPDIGWNTHCDPRQKFATVVGLMDGSPFSATAQIVCQPPRAK